MAAVVTHSGAGIGAVVGTEMKVVPVAVVVVLAAGSVVVLQAVLRPGVQSLCYWQTVAEPVVLSVDV